MTLLPKQLELVIQGLLEEERAKVAPEKQRRFDGKTVKYFQAGLKAEEETRARMPRLDYVERISYLLGRLRQRQARPQNQSRQALYEELLDFTGLWLPALEKKYQEQESQLEKYSQKLCGRDYHCEGCDQKVDPETCLTSLYHGLYCGEQCQLMAGDWV